MALPFWDDVMHQLPNEQAVVDALQSTGTSNGLYYGMQGLFMVVFLGHGMTSATDNMGTYMTIEFISDVLVALVLAWILLKTNARGVSKIGFFAAMLGVLGWLNQNISYWNWYHFPFGYVLLEAVDNVIGTFLAGLVIAWLMNKTKVQTA
jgi:hypothetical protein